MKHLKRFCLLLLALALIGVSGVVWLTVANLPTPKVTKSNCEKIREGMSREEVEAILGSSPNIFAWGGIKGVLETCPYYETRRLPPWESHEIFATVHFVDGKVEQIDIFLRDRTWKERFKDWLPW